MKKIFGLLLLLALLSLCLSCSENTTPLTLNTTSVSLYSGDEHMITSNGTNVSFKSRNPYIAGVNESTGKVIGRTIGKTIIDVTSDQGSAQLNIQVKPKYNTYVEPCIDFYQSKNYIISMFGTPDSETDEGIMYVYPDNKKHFADMYAFENNKLSVSYAIMHQDYAAEAMKFLGERYIPVGISDGGAYVFANGISEETATMLVSMSKMSGYKFYMIIYMPSPSNTRCIFDNAYYQSMLSSRYFDKYQE